MARSVISKTCTRDVKVTRLKDWAHSYLPSPPFLFSPLLQDVVGVRLESNVSFTLTEVAVQSGPCVEWAVVDMGSIREVGVIR